MALQSYANGSGDSPLLGMTVGQLLDEAACRWSDHDALIVVDQGVRWEWRELRERARTFAAGLLALGLEPGDRVGMLASNRAEWVITQFATAYAGLVLVNLPGDDERAGAGARQRRARQAARGAPARSAFRYPAR
jgi:fatty-acyl-CoA synthase